MKDKQQLIVEIDNKDPEKVEESAMVFIDIVNGLAEALGEDIEVGLIEEANE